MRFSEGLTNRGRQAFATTTKFCTTVAVKEDFTECFPIKTCLNGHGTSQVEKTL